MPLRKSHLYSSLWKSCDELRGGMVASQYKDYVLTLLFMKYGVKYHLTKLQRAGRIRHVGPTRKGRWEIHEPNGTRA